MAALGVFVVVTCVLLVGTEASDGGSFVRANDRFVRDGVPVNLFSGCIHYFRIPSSDWYDRLSRLRAMGLNTIETYVAWNFHNYEQGVYDFEGDRDLVAFLETAHSLDMLVMLRAGPYICGEWEFGGFPAWLLNITGIELRTYNAPYIEQVDRWWNVLLPKIQPLLYQNGGPVVMVQMENEFGSYGDVSTNPLDKQYMEHLVGLARTILGDEIILYTTDGGSASYMVRGTLPGVVYTVGDFGPGSNPEDSFAAQRQFNTPGQSPNMCSEFYSGWLTHWGESMANTSSTTLAQYLAQIIALNGSMSLYMGIGGTNFGFYSGANGGGGTSYTPHITSYDYDATISEGGGHGYGSDGVDKYEAVQKVLLANPQPLVPPPPPEPPLPPTGSYGNVTLIEAVQLMASLAQLNTSVSMSQATPQPQEYYGQNYGFTLYRSVVPSSLSGPMSLFIPNVRDRAHIFVNGTFVGHVYRINPQNISFSAEAGSTLDILVENMGRINYGHGMTDPKGIVGGTVYLNNVLLSEWTVLTLPLQDSQISLLEFQDASNLLPNNPTFFRGYLTIDAAPLDSYIYMRNWMKGYIWINGFNLGRYWEVLGPQHTLYIPSSVLRAGVNEIIVLELGIANPDLTVEFVGAPVWINGPICDASVTAQAGSNVVMAAQQNTYASNQLWVWNLNGTISLKSNPSLCMHPGPQTDPQSGEPSIQLAPCSNDPALVFVVGKEDSIVNTQSGLCLDITGHGTSDGTDLEVYSCNYASNQQWVYNAANYTLSSLQPIPSGLPFLPTVCSIDEVFHSRESLYKRN